MTTIAQLHRMNQGSHFHGYGLHGTAPELIDPFLGVDHAWTNAPTFPPHPHAGFSAVSYLFLDSQTGIANRDSRGTRNLIQPGGLHWTAAGSGIVHEEVPAETGKTVHMLQIFVNLPARMQGEPPFALSLEAQDVPVLRLPEARIRVPLGSYGDASSPLKPPVDVRLLDISLDAGARIALPVAAGMNAFVMPVFGRLTIAGEAYEAGDGRVPIFPEQASAHSIELIAGEGGAKAALFSGAPLRQPVYWHGPMALASREALTTALAAYHRGEMGSLEP